MVKQRGFYYEGNTSNDMLNTVQESPSIEIKI